jgi:hypothetical protein
MTQGRKAILSIVVSSQMLCSMALAQGAYVRPDVPIVIGGDQGLDACGGVGRVAGLDPHGDGFLAVKAGPGISYARIDRLYNAKQVYLCVEKGNWWGIVYSKTRQKCNVSSPWPAAMPYTGPCRSGWVHRKWIKLLAG